MRTAGRDRRLDSDSMSPRPRGPPFVMTVSIAATSSFGPAARGGARRLRPQGQRRCERRRRSDASPRGRTRHDARASSRHAHALRPDTPAGQPSSVRFHTCTSSYSTTHTSTPARCRCTRRRPLAPPRRSHRCAAVCIPRSAGVRRRAARLRRRKGGIRTHPRGMRTRWTAARRGSRGRPSTRPSSSRDKRPGWRPRGRRPPTHRPCKGTRAAASSTIPKRTTRRSRCNTRLRAACTRGRPPCKTIPRWLGRANRCHSQEKCDNLT